MGRSMPPFKAMNMGAGLRGSGPGKTVKTVKCYKVYTNCAPVVYNSVRQMDCEEPVECARSRLATSKLSRKTQRSVASLAEGAWSAAFALQ
jgi:hypothetical protein